MERELVVVMPVYNEQDCVMSTVQSWRYALAELNVDFGIIVLNDGSTDATAAVLEQLSSDPHIEIIHKSNSGHGPTILVGYRMAVESASWVFQCDSDDEMPSDSLAEFWRVRHDYDAVIGIRLKRRQPLSRRIITMGSRLAVGTLFGKAVTDVNAPYRLIRSSVLRMILFNIPDDTFAPNVIISGALSQMGAKVCNLPVPHRPRRTGTVSIMKWKMWKAAFRSLVQTWKCRRLFPSQ
jgi:dolichol-phosphate mannosyltransferase